MLNNFYLVLWKMYFVWIVCKKRKLYNYSLLHHHKLCPIYATGHKTGFSERKFAMLYTCTWLSERENNNNTSTSYIPIKYQINLYAINGLSLKSVNIKKVKMLTSHWVWTFITTLNRFLVEHWRLYT